MFARWAGLGLCLAVALRLPAAAAAGPRGFVRREEGRGEGAAGGRRALSIDAAGVTGPSGEALSNTNDDEPESPRLRLPEEGGASASLLEIPTIITGCDKYFRDHSCGWTNIYSCPGQPKGERGRATTTTTKGYICCCTNLMWKREPPGRPLTVQEKAANMARTVMSMNKADGGAVAQAKKVLSAARQGTVDLRLLGQLEAEAAMLRETAEAEELNGAGLTTLDQMKLNGNVDPEEIGEGGPNANTKQPHDNLMAIGDIMPGSAAQAAFFQALKANGTAEWVGGGAPWKEGKVAYCLGPSAKADVEAGGIVLQLMRAAAFEYENALGGCITIRYVGDAACPGGYDTCTCEERPAMVVHRDAGGGGCWSMLGFQGRDFQQLNLGPGCESLGTVVHEIGHALGMGHEHKRKDRDEYVQVLWQNVMDGKTGQFAMDNGYYTASGYDYDSVMHLRSTAFSKTLSLPTMQRKDGRPPDLLGQRVGLSDGDVRQLVDMYKGEVPTCKAREKTGEIGCVDRVDDDGVNLCEGIQDCSSHHKVTSCCACRSPNSERPTYGGIAVQCYAGKPCPSVRRVGTVPEWWMARSHRRRTSKYQFAADCHVKNVSPHPISLSCIQFPGCVHDLKPGEEIHPTCEGEVSQEPCGPYVDLCDLWYTDPKNSPQLPPAPPLLPLEGPARTYCKRSWVRIEGQLIVKVKGDQDVCERKCDTTPKCNSFTRQLLHLDCWLFEKELSEDDAENPAPSAVNYRSFYACGEASKVAPTPLPTPSPQTPPPGPMPQPTRAPTPQPTPEPFGPLDEPDLVLEPTPAPPPSNATVAAPESTTPAPGSTLPSPAATTPAPAATTSTLGAGGED